MREVQLLLITAASSSFLLPSHHPSLNRTKTSASERPWPFLLHNARSLLMPGHGTRLKYYTTESSMVAESLLASTSSPVDAKLMSAGISGSLREGKIRAVVEILGRVEKLGICPLSLFDGSARELLRLECRRLVDGGRLDEFVELVEILAGYGFSIKDLVEPIAIIRMCVERLDPHMAVRYTSILPHSHILFSSVIHEFGKKKDLESALIVFNKSKEKSDAPNMYVCRSIIDICGLCGDSLRSRCIFEGHLLQLFGVLWVISKSVDEFFLSWHGGEIGKVGKRMWRLSLLAILWALWWERNDRCFMDKKRGAIEVFRRAILNVKEWAEA